jgi:hypothetical protein
VAACKRQHTVRVRWRANAAQFGNSLLISDGLRFFEQRGIRSRVVFCFIGDLALFAQDTTNDVVATTPKQDMNGHKTKNAAKGVGHATKKTTKKVVHKTAEETDEGAQKVESRAATQ